MSNLNSESSDFWNLSKIDQINSDSSDFWNLSKKNYKKYTSEEFSSDSDEQDSTEQNTDTEQTAEQTAEQNSEQDGQDAEQTDGQQDEVQTIPKISFKQLNNEDNTDLTSVSVESTYKLPSKQIISNNKKFSDYTFKEFYEKFMKNIIEIVKSLKQGKGLNTIFKDKEKLIHIGILLIIISILLVPLTLN